MSLEVYFEKTEYIDIPFFEDHINRKIDVLKEFSREQTLCLPMTYEQAPIGLKTYLSIKYNKDKAYNVMFCSPDIIFKILKFSSGCIYAPYFPMSFRFMENLQMRVDIDIIKKEKRVHCNTLEAVLMQKMTRKSYFDRACFDNRIIKKIQYKLEKSKIFIRKEGGRQLSNNPINYNLIINHSKIYYRICLVGDTGGVVERVVDFLLQEEMADGNDNIIYFDFKKIGSDFMEFVDRSNLFGANVFDFLFNNLTEKLIVLNSVDVLWLKNKVIYDALVKHLLANNLNRYLIFSRIISNEFIDYEIATIADITVDRSYNEVSIDIKPGEKL